MVENVNIENYLPKSLSYDGNYHQIYGWSRRRFRPAPASSPARASNRGNIRLERANMEHRVPFSSGGIVGNPATSSPTAPAKVELPLHCASEYSSSFLLDSPSDPVVSRSLSYTSESDVSTYSEDYTTMTEDGEGLEQVPCSPIPKHSESTDSFDSDRASLGTLELEDDTAETSMDECLSALEKLTAGLEKHVKGDRETPPLIRLSMADIDLEDSPPSPTIESPETEEPPAVGGDGSFFEDREFDFLRSEPVRRSTSLKTYKTPPGTPRRKKAVRFADALGLDLESVRHILNLETPPKVPDSALKDLKVGLEEEHKTAGTRYLTACFSQPGGDPDFQTRVVAEKVVLENCVVNDQTLTITGTIKVSNITFHKKVTVRYTINSWVTYSDIEASYVHNSSNGATDRFSFTIYLPPYFNKGSRLEFALMFLADGTTFWDNNFGRNYGVECYAKAIPTTDHDTTWMHFL